MRRRRNCIMLSENSINETKYLCKKKFVLDQRNLITRDLDSLGYILTAN